MPRLATPVILPPADASALRAIVKKGTHKSRKITRARALLAMGSGKGAAAVHAEVGISTTQYHRLKRRYWGAGRSPGRALAQRATAEGDARPGSTHH
jgi:putative transposase